MGGTKIKIGGDEGISHYTVYQGKASSIDAKGWEIKIKIDEDGSVSGSNKNEGTSVKKTYSGTFKDGILNVLVDFSDGRQISYSGPLSLSNGYQVKLDFNVLKGGAGSVAGDKGHNTGVLKMDQFSVNFTRWPT